MPHRDDDVEKEEVENPNIKPLVTFGLLTDVQYADIDDGMSYDKKRHRYYRNSLNLVKEAVRTWKQQEIDNSIKLKFLIQLGDIIDLHNTFNNSSLKALNTVIYSLLFY